MASVLVVDDAELFREALKAAFVQEGFDVVGVAPDAMAGIDMTRDIEDRMWTFGCQVKVNRIALNMNQVEEHNPPPNPAKTTDSRYRSYMLEYGDDSWALEALPPQVLIKTITEAVDELRDESLWDEMVEREDEERAVLQRIADNYDVARDAVEEID